MTTSNNTAPTFEQKQTAIRAFAEAQTNWQAQLNADPHADAELKTLGDIKVQAELEVIALCGGATANAITWSIEVALSI